MSYRSLNPEQLVVTLERLARRVAERFPGRGIAAVCDELVQIAREDMARAQSLGAPIIVLRVAVGLFLATGAAGLGYGLWLWFSHPLVETETFSVFQGVEALVNLLILIGAGVWFLLNLEARIKQRRALEDLHALRAIAHVIDMHQLTKDPLIVLGRGPGTASSPQRNMTPFELGRYLDYCSEMLSLAAKLAALYMINTRDPVVIAAVDEIQDLTTSLSRKIWQKIALLDAESRRGPRLPPAALDPTTGEDVVNAGVSTLHPFALGD